MDVHPEITPPSNFHHFRDTTGTRRQIVTINIEDDNLTVGGTGSDRLYGTHTAESLTGAAGDDHYFVTDGDLIVEADNDGSDTVYSNASRALEPNVENLSLTGSANINAIGNTLANRLNGNAGNNLLNGGASADTMQGGGGNDVYVVDHSQDRVFEVAGIGTDTVQASVSFTLAANVENLTQTGTLNVSAIGNANANRLNGNLGNNLLNGGAGADTLQGGAGADTMLGGAGNDLYVVDRPQDQIVEASGAGSDTVQTSASLALAANIDNLFQLGAFNISGFGNAEGNRISGNSGNNLLNGGGGNDSIEGGAGNDLLIGGLGRDILFGGRGADDFVFRSSQESGATGTIRDVVRDFSRAEHDQLDLRSIDANSRLAGDQKFQFIGQSQFSAAAGELRYQRTGDLTIVSGDMNGVST